MSEKERRFGSIEEIERVFFPNLYAENHPPVEPHPEIATLNPKEEE